jgi:glyoxylase-like metal-dependent hydrolase (beta-lactamase superfamily II)
MRIHHLNCGTMCPPFAALINDPAPSSARSLFSRGRMVCHCWLVEGREGLILVDTGLGTQDVAQPRQRLGAQFIGMTSPLCRHEETALAQVKALGFRPEDVRFVLPTHLDVDHAGGLADFPQAEVHLLRREHSAAMQRTTMRERSRYRPVHFAHTPDWRLHDPTGERWFGFESVRPLPGSGDDVLLIPLYGHTRGHAGIAVRSGSGWLLHAGDAYFHHAAIHDTGARVPPGLRLFETLVETERPERLRNRERLRELVKQHSNEVRVVCAHDPSELSALQA